jgi:hypothetical protein
MAGLSAMSADAIDSRDTTGRRGGPIRSTSVLRVVGSRARVGLVGIVAAACAVGCASASKSPEAFHDVLSCKPGETAAQPELPPAGAAAAPVAGTPSDLAVRANELYANEAWNDAIPALLRVARGEGQDDLGNRQLADYELGVAYYHAHRADLSLDQFKAIALDPMHSKHQDALVWLGNLSFIDSLGGAPIDYIYLYSDADIARYDTPELREIGYLLYYLRGRAAYRRGLFDEAMQKMSVVRRYRPYARLADECAGLAGGGAAVE